MNFHWMRWVLTLELLFAPVSASAQHLDILVVRKGEQLVTGTFDFGTAGVQLPVRVFTRGFEFVSSDRANGNDPGFNAINVPPQPYEPLPANEAVQISVRPSAIAERNLSYSSGEGSPTLTRPLNGERFSIALSGVLGPIAELTIAGDSEPVGSFEFATTDPAGAMHQHLDFTLLGREGEPPTPGIYVVPLALGVGSMESNTVYLLMGHDTDERATAALQTYITERLELTDPWEALHDAGAELPDAMSAPHADEAGAPTADDAASDPPREAAASEPPREAAASEPPREAGDDSSEELRARTSSSDCALGLPNDPLGSWVLLTLTLALATARRASRRRGLPASRGNGRT